MEADQDEDDYYNSLSKAEKKKFDRDVRELSEFVDSQRDGDDFIGFKD